MSNPAVISKLEDKLRENPQSLVFARLADLYLDQGDSDKAVALSEKGIQANPYYVTGHFVLAKAHLRRNETDKAEETLKKVLSHDRQHLKAHQLLADLMVKMGWGNRAETHYQDILQIDPLVEGIREILAQLASQAPEEADFTTELVEEDPFSTESLPESSFVSDAHWESQIKEVFPDDKETEHNEPESTPNFDEADSERLSLMPEASDDASIEAEGETLLFDDEDLIDSAMDDLLSESMLDASLEVDLIPEDDTDDTAPSHGGAEASEEEPEDIFDAAMNALTPFPDPGTQSEPLEETEISKSSVDELPSMLDLAESLNSDMDEYEININNFESLSETPQKTDLGDDASFDDLIDQMKDINSKSNIPMSASGSGVENRSDQSDENSDPGSQTEDIDFERLISGDAPMIPESTPTPSHEENTISDEDFFKAINPEEFTESMTPDEPMHKTQSHADEDEPNVEFSKAQTDADADNPDPVIEMPSGETEPVSETPIPKPGQESDAGATKILTPTLGEIYIAQEQYNKALEIYQELLSMNPNSQAYREKVAFLKQKAAGS